MQADFVHCELVFRAESGDVAAQYQLGVRFLLGDSMEQDLEAAYRWLALAAEGLHPDAQKLIVPLEIFRPVRQRERFLKRAMRGARDRSVLMIAYFADCQGELNRRSAAAREHVSQCLRNL